MGDGALRTASPQRTDSPRSSPRFHHYHLLFILLYFPCAVTIASVYQETNLRWTMLVAGWSTGLAYLFATLFYQLATFPQHLWQLLDWSLELSTA